MGHIYALAGPSGVGKTTFLNTLFSNSPPALSLLVRATARRPRPGEREAIDYNYHSEEAFLHRIFSNDFVHVEQYGDSFYGIETRTIEDAIASSNDAIIMAGVYGASRLKTVFGGNVSLLYMFTGDRPALLLPDCLGQPTQEMSELRRRLEEKVTSGLIVPGIPVHDYIARRMKLNLMEIAYVNGRIRSGEDVHVLLNATARMNQTVELFSAFRRRTSGMTVAFSARTNLCFVLMPFRPDLTPIYDDHIVPVVQRLGLACARADRIFSTRPIVDDVLDAVRNARIVISDLTNANPNVFYETGICHALHKPVILLTQDVDVPFDLHHIRQIRYEYTPRGMSTFERALAQTIRGVLAE